MNEEIPQESWEDALALWEYEQMDHQLQECPVIIGLGSHDLGVATRASELYLAGLSPLILFSGANSPTTIKKFPRGEAVHYMEHAVELGVPRTSILLEPKATNTAENFQYSRQVLKHSHQNIRSALLVAKPYEQRRSVATAAVVWPEISLICAPAKLDLAEYIESIGSAKKVIDMLVGTMQRLIQYPKRGFISPQEIPEGVIDSYRRLRNSGFDSRVIQELD